MTNKSRDQERLSALLAELVDGKLSDQQIDELRALMSQDDLARQLYFKHLVTHAMLEWRHGTSGIPASAQVPTDEQSSVSSTPAAANESKTPASVSPPAPVGPPTFGFLGSITGSFAFYPVAFMLALLVVGAALQALRGLWHAGPELNNQQRVAQAGSTEGAIANSSNDSVAKLTAGVNCEWDGANAPAVGDPLVVGRLLKLKSGVAELTFDIGARVILQSPIALSVDSPKSIRLESGKLTAEITRAEARGFKVLTPDAAFVDQGTEFGVEVAPGGSSRIHVFKGEVDLALGSQPNSAAPSHRLLANSGARLWGKSPNVTFVQDTGETFLRSMDQTERDLHVVAYWRFEDHPVGTLLPDTKGNTEVTVATVDSSFNGNDLFTYFQHTRPSFSEEVPAVTVPQNGRPNRTCLDNTEFPGPVSTRDVYTNSAFSHASPMDIQRISPGEWTIEASVKVMELGRTETFVGRDGGEVHANIVPCLAFQVTAEGHLAIQFKDAEDRLHRASANDFSVEADRWYHVAGVSNGKQLLLYVNSLDGRGYRLLAKADLPSEGSTALGSGGPNAVWSIGRGKAQNGVPGQWFKGWIDEVRVCDVALDPSEFLFFDKKATYDIGNDSTSSDGLASFVGN
jgi:hypothetical protein